MHWITRTIVCGFATASISIPLFSVMVGCASSHGMYGGIGTELAAGEEFERESGDTIAEIGYRAKWLLHERDKVGAYIDARHESHPGARDRGKETVFGGFYLDFK